MPPARRRSAKLLRGLLLATLMLAALEGLARLAGTAAASEEADVGLGGFRNLLVDLGGFAGADRVLEADPELFWKLRPGVHDVAWHPPLWIEPRSNGLGYRDPERDYAAPAGTFRLLCLGDSCTYGVGVRIADGYPQQLEALLARAYPDRLVEVWNGGVPGWSSDQGRTLLERDGALIQPTVVTIAFGINDSRHRDFARHKERGHGHCCSDREARATLSRPLARADRALQRLALYRLMARWTRRDESEGPGAKQVEGGVRVPDVDFRDNLKSMVARARELGAAPVLVVWPIRWQLETPADRGLDPPTSYQLSTRQLATELATPLLDLLERLRGTSGIWVDSVHMNEEGCRRVAEELGRLLEESRLLPARPEPPPR